MKWRYYSYVVVATRKLKEAEQEALRKSFEEIAEKLPPASSCIQVIDQGEDQSKAPTLAHLDDDSIV